MSILQLAFPDSIFRHRAAAFTLVLNAINLTLPTANASPVLYLVLNLQAGFAVLWELFTVRNKIHALGLSFIRILAVPASLGILRSIFVCNVQKGLHPIILCLSDVLPTDFHYFYHKILIYYLTLILCMIIYFPWYL